MLDSKKILLSLWLSGGSQLDSTHALAYSVKHIQQNPLHADTSVKITNKQANLHV